MVKFKVEFPYQDYKLNKFLDKNTIVDMTVKRANEVNEKLKKHGTVLSRVEKK